MRALAQHLGVPSADKPASPCLASRLPYGTAVVCCSALAAGSGFVTSRHGRLPVPAPAVLRIAAAAGSQVVTVKVAGTTDGLAGSGTATAELAEAEAAARALGWPVRAVCEAAAAQYRAQADPVGRASPARPPGGFTEQTFDHESAPRDCV